jgi:predicted lipoprotein
MTNKPCLFACFSVKRRSISGCFGVLLFGVLLVTSSCETNQNDLDNWDRSAMLSHWSNEIIVPAWNQFANTSLEAVHAADTFALRLDSTHFEILRSKYKTAYGSWQKISLFEIGPGEQLNIRLRCNTYPTDTTIVKGSSETFMSNNPPNLLLPSTFTQQGFPALDYLLFAKGSIKKQLEYYSIHPEVVGYIQMLFSNIALLGNEVYTDWTSGYKTIFVQADGSSATASVNKMANDFIFHYEKELRAGKVGIPAGIFSVNTLPQNVESIYHPEFSNELFQVSFNAHVNFFNGYSFDGLSQGPSFSEYLDHLAATEDTIPLSDAVNQQFDETQTALNTISESFKATVENDVFALLALYDELQRNTIRIKTEVMQVLNVKIDYVDADGD